MCLFISFLRYDPSFYMKQLGPGAIGGGLSPIAKVTTSLYDDGNIIRTNKNIYRFCLKPWGRSSLLPWFLRFLTYHPSASASASASALPKTF